MDYSSPYSYRTDSCIQFYFASTGFDAGRARSSLRLCSCLCFLKLPSQTRLMPLSMGRTVRDCASTHIVTTGETLSGIAVSTGVSLSALAEHNHLSITDQVLNRSGAVYPARHWRGFARSAFSAGSFGSPGSPGSAGAHSTVRYHCQLDRQILQHSRSQRGPGPNPPGCVDRF